MRSRGRWLRAIRDKTFDLIRNLPILETRSQHFLEVLAAGTVATNAYLRRVHNFALDMNWLSCPLIVRKQWPRVQFKKKRAASVSNRRRRYAPASFRYSLRCAYAPVCPLADRRPKPTSS